MRIVLAIFLSVLIGHSCIAQDASKSGTISVSSRETSVYTIVEEMPRYPGGEDAMLRYLGANVNYPDSAKANGIGGIVYCSFTVDTTGMIQDTEVLRGIGGGCNEEAIRVVNAMPRWNPGKQRGQYVNVRYTIPIRFVLR